MSTLLSIRRGGRWWGLAISLAVGGLPLLSLPSRCVWADAQEPDVDRDGFPDSWEQRYFGHLAYGAQDDPDGDQLSNRLEYYFMTDPQQADTDGDGLSDSEEINTYLTDPRRADTDADGLSDAEEIRTWGTDPLTPDTDQDGLGDAEEIGTFQHHPFLPELWEFAFQAGGQTHRRSPQGLRISDHLWGSLDVMPWMELMSPVSQSSGRGISRLEIARRGIAAWAEAGATEIGLSGSPSWLDDQDARTPGYQNRVVDELKALADAHGIKIVFGLKWISVWENGWRDFFAPPRTGDMFERAHALMQAVTSHTGTTQWILEGETAFRSIRDAYSSGEFDLTPADLAAFKDNLRRLRLPGVTVHIWTPFLYVTEDGTMPTAPANRTDNMRYVYSKLFEAIYEVFGQDVGQIGAGKPAYYAIRSRRSVPYGGDRLRLFEALERMGAVFYQQLAYMYRPYRHFPDPKDPTYEERGPAEWVADLPYFFGRQLDNRAFPSLPFRRVFIYPGAERFDLGGQAFSHYVHHGMRVNVLPSDEIVEGQPVAVILSVRRQPYVPLTITASYAECEPASPGCRPGWSLADDVPKFESRGVLPDGATQQAVIRWTPGFHRGGRAAAPKYYWINWTVSDAQGTRATFPVRLTVSDFGVGSSVPHGDMDGDGYTNEDETANHTDPENATSTPADQDGDFLSDLADVDENNDGVPEEPSYRLTLLTEGSGSVVVEPLQATYAKGAVVSLRAVPGTGSRLAGWSGDASGRVNPIWLTIDAEKTIRASFGVNHPPVVTRMQVRTLPDMPASITLGASDADADAVSLRITQWPLYGRLQTGALPRVTYLPPPGFQGADRFFFEATDGQMVSPAALVNVSVTIIPPRVMSSEPPSGFIDPAQDINPTTGAAEGIQTLHIRFDQLVYDPSTGGRIGRPNFTLSETTTRPPPRVLFVAHESGTTYTLKLDRPLTAGACTTIIPSVANAEGMRIEALASNRIAIGALPGDVTGDRRSLSGDVSTLQGLLSRPGQWPLSRTDINRDGVFTSADAVRLRTLLSGTPTTRSWIGAWLRACES